MPLNIDSVDYSDSPFCQVLGSEMRQSPHTDRKDFRVYRVGSAPLGKHSLDECEEYERLWRQEAADTIIALRGDWHGATVWAEGAFESDGILAVMAYVDDWNKIGCRYHIEGFTYPGGRGYYTSWLSFDLDSTLFQRIMRDSTLNLEFIRLHMILCPTKLDEVILEMRFGEIELPWILANSVLAITSMAHFEGCYVLGAKDVIDRAIEKVRK